MARLPDAARTDATVELLQALIRNECVNEGTADSGHETRNADVLREVVAVPGVQIERFGPTPERQSVVARLPGTDPTAPSLCLMGHTDVVPADPTEWTRDPFGGELVAGEVWGRGAIDMLNLTSSMAVAFAELARRPVRQAGDLLYFAVADEEAGSAHGARWAAEHQADAVRADYVLTESGGIHSGPADRPFIGVNVAEKGVAWRRLRITGVPGHGSMPFRADNALVATAAVVERLATYQAPARITELWTERVRTLGLDEDATAQLLDPGALDELLEAMPSRAGAAYLHACTHTTLSPNAVAGAGKTNTIPGVVLLDVDIRTLPGESSEDVDGHLRAALGELYGHVEVDVLMDDPASTSPIDTPLWDALGSAVANAYPSARLTPQMTVGFTDARVYRDLGAVAYGAGLFSPEVDAADLSARFHGRDERVDVESLRLTTNLWVDVVDRMWS